MVLRISEAKDAGGGDGKRVDRYDFYEHCKVLLATPPDVLRVNEKYVREYYIMNVLAVIITSNHRDALYLQHNDRRHRVVDSASKKAEFGDDYWEECWDYYNYDDGLAHVAAHLHTVDLRGFKPKAAPPKNDAFENMANRGNAPEEIDLTTQSTQSAILRR